MLLFVLWFQSWIEKGKGNAPQGSDNIGVHLRVSAVSDSHATLLTRKHRRANVAYPALCSL